MEKNSTIQYTDIEAMFEITQDLRKRYWSDGAFSIEVDSDSRRKILSLPIKDGNSIKRE